MTIIVGLAILNALVIVHELGHSVVARMCGVPVPLFSVGMGPVIYRKQIGQTSFQLALLPLGGYVLLEGADEPGRHHPLKMILVYLGGPLANAALAFLLLLSMGRPGLFLEMNAELLRVLGGLFSGQISIDHLAGPVGIVGVAGQASAAGWKSVMAFSALLSLNLFILNLVPIPVLDGGQILRVSYEWITGRYVSFRARLWLAGASWVLLLGLVVYLTNQDIRRLFQQKKTNSTATKSIATAKLVL